MQTIAHTALRLAFIACFLTLGSHASGRYNGWFFFLQDTVWSDTTGANGEYLGLAGTSMVFRQQKDGGYQFRFINVATLVAEDRWVAELPWHVEQDFYVIRTGGPYGHGSRPFVFYNWKHERLWTLEDARGTYPFGFATARHFLDQLIFTRMVDGTSRRFVELRVFDALTGTLIGQGEFEQWHWAIFRERETFFHKENSFFIYHSGWLAVIDWSGGSLSYKEVELPSPIETLGRAVFLGHEDLFVDLGGQVFQARTMTPAGSGGRMAELIIPLPGAAFLAADGHGQVSIHKAPTFKPVHRFYSWEYDLSTSINTGPSVVVGDRIVYHAGPSARTLGALDHQPGVYVIDGAGLLETVSSFSSVLPRVLSGPAPGSGYSLLGTFDGLFYFRDTVTNRIVRYEAASGLLADYVRLPENTLHAALNKEDGRIVTLDTSGDVRILNDFQTRRFTRIFWLGSYGMSERIGWLGDTVFIDYREGAGSWHTRFLIDANGFPFAFRPPAPGSPLPEPYWLPSIRSYAWRGWGPFPGEPPGIELTHLPDEPFARPPRDAPFPRLPEGLSFRAPVLDSSHHPFFVVGTGHVVQTPVMRVRADLETLVDAATWTEHSLITLADNGASTGVRAYDVENLSLLGTAEVHGSPVSVHAQEDSISVLTRENGRFLVTRFDRSLSHREFSRPLKRSLFDGEWLGYGWRYSTRLAASYHLGDNGWSFLQNTGWIFFANDDSEIGWWLWNAEKGWFYASHETLPYSYSPSSREWFSLND